jgi:hypothetical protein
MKLAKIRRMSVVVPVTITLVAGFVGVLPIDILIPVLLFAGVVYWSVALIEKAIAGAAHAKEFDGQ